MTAIDIFHGDADGLCAIQQIRLAEPLSERQVVAGRLNQHSLLMSISTAENSNILMLDLPLNINIVTLKQLLAQKCRVRCFDHHVSSEQLEHENLDLKIDTSPQVCTSTLVNNYLGGSYQAWAAVGAFGDTLPIEARKLLSESELSENEIEQLKYLSELLNYNAYGDLLNVGHIPIQDMHENMLAYDNPLDFVRGNELLERIGSALTEDLDKAEKIAPIEEHPDGMVFILSPRGYINRIRKVWLGRLSMRHPQRAFLLALENHNGSLDISIRAPLDSPKGAHELASRFGGGGREGAASVQDLSPTKVTSFLDMFWNWSESLHKEQTGKSPERRSPSVTNIHYGKFQRGVKSDLTE